MYNVQVNENNFYTGSYATIGTVKNGVNVSKLPPSENSLCYKLVDVEITKEIQESILEFSKMTESETEFYVYYSLKSTDEEGNEIKTPITEDEYNALSDEEKENVLITQIPKMVTIVLSKDEYNALTDEEKDGFIAAYKEDENGQLVYQTIEVKEIVKDWEFSQERFEELETIKTIQQQENERVNKSLSSEQQRADIDYIALMTGIDLSYDTYAVMTMSLDEHSNKYNDVKQYYDTKLWTKERVYNMVSKNVITPEEYKEITGEDYIN